MDTLFPDWETLATVFSVPSKKGYPDSSDDLGAVIVSFIMANNITRMFGSSGFLRIRLAPLCGVTDFIFRSICYQMGCELAYTEMISAMGYLCAPNQQATQALMIRGNDEPRLILQLFGKDPSVVAEAAARIDQMGKYDGIDLNMGCPARKVASSGEGCGLMRTPDIAYRMMKLTVQSVSVPVSVKMRLGWDSDHINIIEYAQMAEEAGIPDGALL